MAVLAAYAYLSAIVGVICFQIALISGVPWGHLTQGGQVEGVLPVKGRIAAGISIVLLLFMAGGVASAADLWPEWPQWTGWAALGIQTLSMLANWATPSKAERKLWGPITTAMVLAAALVVFAS